MTRILAVAAFLALTVTAAQAEDIETASTFVRYGDLNLSNPADTKILADRLHSAAKSVCMSTGNASGELQECMNFAIGQAISRIEASVESKLDTDVRLQLDGSEREAMANP